MLYCIDFCEKYLRLFFMNFRGSQIPMRSILRVFIKCLLEREIHIRVPHQTLNPKI
jgi:hypothetical protein